MEQSICFDNKAIAPHAFKFLQALGNLINTTVFLLSIFFGVPVEAESFHVHRMI